MDDPRGAPLSVPRPSPTGPDPLIGRMINERYRIVGTIARGGMGKVYRAEQQPLGRLVALKVLNPNYTGENDPEFHKRFFLEASIASKLTHPNTVTIFDYGKTDDEVFYIAMELLEGRTLHRALREEGPFRPDRAMHIARQICRSLREAHSLGVIHRDLKPANVYLVQHGDESDFVKVLDFGLVKNLDDKPGEELTQTGLFMGSPKYMSPEQIRGERVDGRVDVYALGVILFEMLTGKVPYDRANSVNILMAHIQEDIPSISVFNPNIVVPATLENVVRRCMAKDPAQRFASMDEVLAALKQCSNINTTMSGEFRVSDLVDPRMFVDGANPGSTSVHLRGDMLTGGTPTPGLAQQSGMQGLPPISASLALPASGSMGLPQMPAAPAKSNKGLFVGLAVALLAGGGGAALFMSKNQADSTAEKPAAVAPSQAEAAPAASSTPQPAEAAPAAVAANAASAAAPTEQANAQGPNAAANATVLVSLRSTPAGAMVAVGDREYGPTPTQIEWTGADAAIGREVTFRFQRKGYRDLTVTRQIRGDRLEVEAPPMDPMPVKRPTRDDHPAGSTVVAPPKPAAPLPSLKGYKAEPY